jgi:hypothetical protein
MAARKDHEGVKKEDEGKEWAGCSVIYIVIAVANCELLYYITPDFKYV